MKFGPVPLARAEGTILAHSITAGGRKLRKGRVLTAADIALLKAAGITEVTTARLSADDVSENTAADQLAAALVGDAGITATEGFTGRVNLVAARAGVFTLDTASVVALNRIDPGITLATLADHTRVSAGMMVGTVKIIPYAVPQTALEAALEPAARATLHIAPPVIRQADVILTRTPGFPEKLLAKGEKVVRDRLTALGVGLRGCETVVHQIDAVAEAIDRSRAELVLILGASATSDAADVCPAGLTAAGGALTRFGMPVDPGNLLFLGSIDNRAVVGLPGCARSPAMNGADWVLERLVCGLPVTDGDIAAMGVGGLLKEIPVRPHPRVISTPPVAAPRVDIVLLAAGSARRMRGDDKLLRRVDGVPLLRRAALAAMASAADTVHVVLPPEADERRAVLEGTGVQIVTAVQASEGMGASLRAGMHTDAAQGQAVIVALADMPDVSAPVYNALIAAYDPESGAEICRAASADGVPGHPILFGRRFFEALSEASGDVGARHVLTAAQEFVVPVQMPDQSPVLDLDTPEAWAAYEAAQG